MLKHLLWIIPLFLLSAYVYLADLPDTTQLLTENPTTSAIRIYRENQIRDRGGRPRSLMAWRNMDQISPYLWQAVLMAEDDTFFIHNGFDVEQIKRAFHENWKRRRFAFGASTITQQLARTLYLSSHKNIIRKVKEALITRRLEKTLPKKRILELYLNVVEWGPQVYGAEAAAQYFFAKPAADLTLEEAVSLAVILPSPWRWKPQSQSKFMNNRRADIIERMVRAKYIPPPVEAPLIGPPPPGELGIPGVPAPSEETEDLDEPNLSPPPAYNEDKLNQGEQL